MPGMPKFVSEDQKNISKSLCEDTSIQDLNFFKLKFLTPQSLSPCSMNSISPVAQDRNLRISLEILLSPPTVVCPVQSIIYYYTHI